MTVSTEAYSKLNSNGSGGGCGCSGSCTCACCAAVCDPCTAEGLSRPQFFAGQLLTEDDLQGLSDYVAAKLRLRNRYVRGEGVVCGLLVTCHPCKPGWVRVGAGYALDCCGNDIVVPCPEEVNIIELRRELRTKLRGGYDCGDPCTDPTTPPAGAAASGAGGAAAADAADKASPSANGEVDPALAPRRYCLYVKYCEEDADPVAPYETGESCDRVQCVPSRIREGYRFELRCPDGHAPPPTVWDRIKACFDELTGAESASDDAKLAAEWSFRTKQALEAKEAGRIELTTADRQALREGPRQLSSFQARANAKEPPDELTVRAAVDDLHATAAAVSKFHHLDPVARTSLSGDVPKQVQTATNEVRDVELVLRRHLSKMSKSRDRIIADEIINQSLIYVEQNAQRETVQARVFEHRAVTSPSVEQVIADALRRLRQWLLDRIEHSCHLTDCGLLKEVLSVRLPAGGADLDVLIRAAWKLFIALIRYLLDCICAALNPPCPPCEDASVLLACLTVEECEVTDICNLERTFVLSSTALRYWVPLLQALGSVFEKLCCEVRFKLPFQYPRAKERTNPTDDAEISKTVAPTGLVMMMAPAHLAVERSEPVAAMLRATGLKSRTAGSFVNLMANLGMLSWAAAERTHPADVARLADIDRILSAGRAAFVRPEVLARPDPEATIRIVDERFDEKSKAISKAMTGEIRTERQGRERVVKDLQKTIGQLEKSLGKLEKRFAKLEGKKA